MTEVIEAKGVQNQAQSHKNDIPMLTECRLNSLPIQQAVSPQWTVETSILLKLKMTDLVGDPQEWLNGSTIFNAVTHNAPIDDNAKKSHLKTLLKGKAKAAIASFGYPGIISHCLGHVSPQLWS